MNSYEALEIIGLPWPRTGKVSCPAHADKTPSLHLYQDHFYCFSCGANGDGYGLIALFQERDVADVLREYGDGAPALNRPQRRVTLEVGPNALRRDLRRRLREAEYEVFDRLWEVFGPWEDDFFLAEIDNMTLSLEELVAEIDDEDVPLVEKRKRIDQWRREQMRWLDKRDEKLNGRKR